MTTRYPGLALAALLLAACPALAGTPQPGDPGYVAEDPGLARLVGRPAPGVTLQGLDGTLVNLADLYGSKPVYLKLWASYCLPCRAQMPKFERIFESSAGRIQVIAVNAGVGDDADEAKHFAIKAGLRMPLTIDDGSLGTWLGLQGTPFHLVIGRDGRIIFAGHQDGPALDAALRRAIDSPLPKGIIRTSVVRKLAPIRTGDAVPTLTLTGAGGTQVRFQAGATPEPRAILFTATWCESYLADIEPATAASCRTFKNAASRSAASGTVRWLGIASHLWTTPDALAGYGTRPGQPIPYAIDTDGAAFQRFGIRRFPAVALIDPDGRLARLIGPDDHGLLDALQRADIPLHGTAAARTWKSVLRPR